MYTSHIFIDLEMNPISREFPEEKEACRAEVIEIGAVRLDADYNLTDRFTLFVRPRYSTELNRHVAKLTGFPPALERLLLVRIFADRANPVHSSQRVPCSGMVSVCGKPVPPGGFPAVTRQL